MRAVVVAFRTVGGLPQIGRLARVLGLVGLLGGESGSGQVTVEQAGRDRVGEQVATVLAPTQYSRRRGWSAACSMARAATSGW
ncbi:hypothetical protein GCM10009555_061300 [Acrocarpospora macrocephala]|uniref:Uncharacterized protein n=1 Tax=Acrocarpospora macrocephala TaxID=150177 RepID=A0A5M3WS65_9ACTN|nr:hypothetical protein Amac_031690 [Acrocarpospora macrocephala]